MSWILSRRVCLWIYSIAITLFFLNVLTGHLVLASLNMAVAIVEVWLVLSGRAK